MPFDFASAGSILSGIGAVGGLFGGKKKGPSIEDQMAAQTEMWKRQIPAMVEGAKSVGLHPLVAAGINPATFSSSGSVVGDNKFEKLQDAGQNIARAAQSYMTKEERVINDTANALKLDNLKAQNELLRAQTTNIQRSTTPPLGGGGSGIFKSSGDISVVPKEIIANTGDREVGVSPISQVFDAGGHPVRGLSNAAQQSMEDTGAGFYYGLTRTIPDMIAADAKYIRKRLRDFHEGGLYQLKYGKRR